MKTIALNIPDSILEESELIITKVNITRNQYINEALEFYNKVQKRNILESSLKFESELVRNDSMQILKDYEKLV